MKKILAFAAFFALSFYFADTVFAQSAVVGAPAVVAAAPAVAVPAASPSPSFIMMIVSIVACLNIGLSAVQQIFSNLAKLEPGWLQSLSSIVLAISKYLGSNPNV